jgi:hypothetical protein
LAKPAVNPQPIGGNSLPEFPPDSRFHLLAAPRHGRMTVARSRAFHLAAGEMLAVGMAHGMGGPVGMLFTVALGTSFALVTLWR